MSRPHPLRELAPDALRQRIDPASLGFETTADLAPADEIIGQQRGVEAFRFGMGMTRRGYNIFVTGQPGTGRLATVKKLLEEFSGHDGVPDDLCYVHNFRRPEAPQLLRFKAGDGAAFRKAVQDMLEGIRRETPQVFESEDYLARKNAIAESHEKKILAFYKSIEDKVKDTGLVVVRMQMGPLTRPDVLPLVDGEPKRLIELEEMVTAGKFPAEELERLKKKRAEVKDEIDHIVVEVHELQKQIAERQGEVDRLVFTTLAAEFMDPVRRRFADPRVGQWLDAVLQDMIENLEGLRQLGKPVQGPMPFMVAGPSAEALFRDYQVNLLVDNAEQQGPPVIIESYPTYRNLFGSIERVMDRHGGWRTDFTKIKAGSFIRANGGYLVINLMDAILEPGVWQTLKRSLKTEEIEIETYDPYYFITATGLKPEPIRMEVKVVVLGTPRLWALLRHYDADTAQIFKIRADYEPAMDRSDAAEAQVARFVRSVADKEGLLPFTAGAVAALLEHAIRMAGRREKLSTAFPLLADLLAEADHLARRDQAEAVAAEHLEAALRGRIYRSNRTEELIQEMIDRGTLLLDLQGAVVGQINGLAVYSTGDYAFGRPSRITVATAMGREGIINIERDADLSGPTHNKGVQILAGYLRRVFAQDKPLGLAASIAFEQSYGGVDGDSASSTELYALLSSLANLPLRQDVAVTGSVNQRGEIQAIGGVNEKIEGFYRCCRKAGLTGRQGVLIPAANEADLMLDPEVVQAVAEGRFHVWSAGHVAQGLELLTGRKAGVNKDGSFRPGGIYDRVNKRLKALAEGLRAFGRPSNRKPARPGGAQPAPRPEPDPQPKP
ncbi:MAG: Lon protease family protein [Desulfovibrionaceae bacterium]